MPAPCPRNWRASTRNSGSGYQARLASVIGPARRRASVDAHQVGLVLQRARLQAGQVERPPARTRRLGNGQGFWGGRSSGCSAGTARRKDPAQCHGVFPAGEPAPFRPSCVGLGALSEANFSRLMRRTRAGRPHCAVISSWAWRWRNDDKPPRLREQIQPGLVEHGLDNGGFRGSYLGPVTVLADRGISCDTIHSVALYSSKLVVRNVQRRRPRWDPPKPRLGTRRLMASQLARTALSDGLRVSTWRRTQSSVKGGRWSDRPPRAGGLAN